MLSSGGYIVASVPNIAHVSIRLMLLQGRFDYADTGILDDTHLKYYTRRSIGDLLESCGYMVEVMDWTEQRVSEQDLREVLDPLDLANLEAVIEEFSTWEAVAFQYLIKAFPVSEEAKLNRLSEEKVQADRQVKVLEIECSELKTENEQLKMGNKELEDAREHMGVLRDQIEKKDVYIKTLEEGIDERQRSLMDKDRQIEELEKKVKELESGAEQAQGRRRRR
jgi:hypothetical protein